MKLLNLSFFGKAAFAVFAFLLIANFTSAQTLTVYNMTPCNKSVDILTVTGCSTPNTPVNVSVGPWASPFTQAFTGDITELIVSAGATCSYAPSPSISLVTPGCLCSGATFDTGSFTVGGTTVNASSGCSGTPGDITLYIW